MKTRLTREEVLCYRPVPVAKQGTVRRHYARWRKEEGIPHRCDEPSCRFYTEPLEWNGKPLPLILDHKNGVRLDNSLGNLRYLCPNCDSQQDTRGGANRGRLAEAGDGKYESFDRKTGVRDFRFFPGGGSLTISAGPPVTRSGPALAGRIRDHASATPPADLVVDDHPGDDHGHHGRLAAPGAPGRPHEQRFSGQANAR